MEAVILMRVTGSRAATQPPVPFEPRILPETKPVFRVIIATRGIVRPSSRGGMRSPPSNLRGIRPERARGHPIKESLKIAHPREMTYRIAADFVVLTHFAFVLFVALGGFLVIRWNRLAWVHLPVALYGCIVEFVGFVCPLTPLENHLRRLGGEAGYKGGFVEEYIIRVLYLEGLTREIGIMLGLTVVVLNVIAYAIVLRRRRPDSQRSRPE